MFTNDFNDYIYMIPNTMEMIQPEKRIRYKIIFICLNKSLRLEN